MVNEETLLSVQSVMSRMHELTEKEQQQAMDMLDEANKHLGEARKFLRLASLVGTNGGAVAFKDSR